MNIKNIFITTSLSVMFGYYSIYNIFNYLHDIKDKLNEITILEKKLEETTTKYKELSFEFTNITCEINMLSKKVIELENKHFLFYSNYNFVNSIYSSPEDILVVDKDNDTTHYDSDNVNTDETSSSVFNELNDANLDHVNFDDIDLELSHENIEKKNILDYDCIEIINDLEKNSIKLTPCSSRTNSFASLDNKPRSSSVSDVNWSGLTKKFLFG
jgi:predicted nuclease with TOPRIM domain